MSSLFPNLVLVIVGFTSLLLGLLVLLQKGKGSGLSDMFGGGFSSHSESAYAQKNLASMTVAVSAIWVSSIIAYAIII